MTIRGYDKRLGAWSGLSPARKARLWQMSPCVEVSGHSDSGLVIAVVMDVFTDIDIFRDLQEISRKQGVAVYILLDQALLSQFLDMCMDLKVHPEQEKLMTVRTITGSIYYARSGTKIVGQVHEKFTLIDGIRVATGSY
ncbi:protein FAM83D-like, partial [Leptonychotes weddellii]|uniref:Protein FAM83D-like n=1 Tax=Leptonychotes weddellii TaxID=9713 RepID=A0A7F8RC87_LEPWE